MTGELQSAIGRCADDGRNRPLPAGCYAKPEFFDWEIEHLLRPGWHPVARFDELPTPGDFRTVDLFGERVLLVRGAGGELRALSAICLHRAFPIAEGEGNAANFVCPYHKWAYDLEGRLQGAPFMEDVDGFDRKSCRLPEFALEIWQGFVLVNTSDDPAPFAPQLEALSGLLEPVGLDQLVSVGHSDWDSPWNWKVMIDNFMESYHHMGPHANTLAKTHPARGTHDLPIDGPCSVLENPAVEGVPPFWVVHVFPTLLIAPNRGEHPFCAWYEMRIDRHDHLHLRIHALINPSQAEDSDAIAAIQSTLEAIHREDIPVCEGVQRGLQSRIWEPGLLSEQEATLAHFHRFIARAVARTT